MQKSFEKLKKYSPCFFLGANSGNGFISFFDQCYDVEEGEKLFIIKGGPGTGKSSFMKSLAVNMKEKVQKAELYFCSSDPDSLDGVRFSDIGISFVDGTAPHTMEPKMLGVGEEMINLGDFLDAKKLDKKKIVPLYHEHEQYHKKASRYLQASSRLLDDSYALACKGCNMEKVEQIALRFVREMLTDKGKRGKETKRFLSGFTSKGHLLLEKTLTNLADTVIGIADEYGSFSSVFLSIFRDYALQYGYSIIVCYCALTPQRKIDHIILPELGLAFCTTNWFVPITVDTSKRIHARNFYDYGYLGKYKQRLRFNRRAVEELLDGAYDNLKLAKEIHDCLENHYIQAMDFEGVTRLSSEFLKRIG